METKTIKLVNTTIKNSYKVKGLTPFRKAQPTTLRAHVPLHIISHPANTFQGSPMKMMDSLPVVIDALAYIFPFQAIYIFIA